MLFFPFITNFLYKKFIFSIILKIFSDLFFPLFFPLPSQKLFVFFYQKGIMEKQTKNLLSVNGCPIQQN